MKNNKKKLSLTVKISIGLILGVLAGILLRKGLWWGCFFGIAVGGILVYNGVMAQPRMMLGLIAGLVLVAYYTLMGILCGVSRKKR